MIKIKIQAGLGNQFFQYALARAIKEKTKTKGEGIKVEGQGIGD